MTRDERSPASPFALRSSNTPTVTEFSADVVGTR